MQYIIDGHNLIPHIPGLSLADPDDEQVLIEQLVEFCRIRRAKVRVFFDKAPAGQSGMRKFGAVVAVFVSSKSSADNAIAAHLQKLRGGAQNTMVVSSDRMVAQSARSKHAGWISSKDFARTMQAAWESTSSAEPEKPLSEEEISQWEKIFEKRSEKAN